MENIFLAKLKELEENEDTGKVKEEHPQQCSLASKYQVQPHPFLMYVQENENYHYYTKTVTDREILLFYMYFSIEKILL